MRVVSLYYNDMQNHGPCEELSVAEAVGMLSGFTKRTVFPAVRWKAYRIKQISPVAPSLTIRFKVPLNLRRTSSGIRMTLAVNPS